MLRGSVGVIVVVWLLIGVLAAWQRDYFRGGDTSCGTAGRIALTVIAGPLNLSLIHISEPTRRLRGSRMPSSA